MNHPIFRFLRGRPDPIPSATIVRYFPTLPRSPGARVLASYVSGQPFLIESSAGRGRVLLVTTALDSDWTTLPLSNFFLPFVQSTVRYLAGGGTLNRNISAGQPIVATVEDTIDDKSASIQTPSGRRESVAVSRYEDRTDLLYERSNEPGVYRLNYQTEGKAKSLHFVVSPPRAESDLTPLSDEQWRMLSSRLGLSRIDPDQISVADAVARDRLGKELWPILITSIFVFALLEMLLARWWSVQGV